MERTWTKNARNLTATFLFNHQFSDILVIQCLNSTPFFQAHHNLACSSFSVKARAIQKRVSDVIFGFHFVSPFAKESSWKQKAIIFPRSTFFSRYQIYADEGRRRWAPSSHFQIMAGIPLTPDAMPIQLPLQIAQIEKGNAAGFPNLIPTLLRETKSQRNLIDGSRV